MVLTMHKNLVRISMQRIKNKKKEAQPHRLRQKPYSFWDKAVPVCLSSRWRNGQFAFDYQVIIVSNTLLYVLIAWVQFVR